MKKAISLVSIFLCVILCIGISPSAASAADKRNLAVEETMASSLKELGLFQGVSETDFDLDREPSRAEAVVMLIRVLGKETEATSGTWEHPFTDVPQWADQYIGYAYQHGLTSGSSATEFGNSNASAAMYLTFVLRALGYSDANGQDFTWSNPFFLAKSAGVLPDSVDTAAFWRADVVLVSYTALAAHLKDSGQTLAQKLIAAGVFTEAQYNSYYDTTYGTAKEELSSEEIYQQCSPAVFYIEVYNSKGVATASGSGFFLDSNGTAVTNYHVIDGAYSAKVTVSDTGKVYDILGVSDYNADEDWAIIQVNGTGFSYLEQGDASTIVGGAVVYAIGSPLGLQNSISQGIISNPKRLEGNISYIQTSAAISSGSSGGALINKYGQVIGITSASYLNGQNLNLALPISFIQGHASSALTSLSSLAAENSSLPKNSESYDQQGLAYFALCEWIKKNYNIEISGEKAYEESISTDAGIDRFTLIYDTSIGCITLMHTSIYQDTHAYSYIGLTSSDRKFFSMLSYYGPGNYSDDPTFSGTGYIDAASFDEDASYSFSQYEGDPTNLSEYQTLAKYMYLNSLSFTDYAFSAYLQNVGSFNMTDFGFPSL